MNGEEELESRWSLPAGSVRSSLRWPLLETATAMPISFWKLVHIAPATASVGDDVRDVNVVAAGRLAVHRVRFRPPCRSWLDAPSLQRLCFRPTRNVDIESTHAGRCQFIVISRLCRRNPCICRAWSHNLKIAPLSQCWSQGYRTRVVVK